MKIAVLANLSAGGGKAAEVLEQIRKAWQAHELIGAAGFGGEMLPRCLKAESSPKPYLPALKAALSQLLAQSPDLLVTVGGDGTAAYAAEELLTHGAGVPLFGIGTGTANVGPIVSCRAGDPLPDPSDLKAERLGAVEALTLSGSHIAYGFNDLVLGNTFLGTDENGETATYAAAALAGRGILKKERPLRKILKREGCFRKNGTPLPAPPYTAAQLIASPVERDNYYGRAVTGRLCCTPNSPYQAAVYISPIPIVSMEENSAGFDSWFPGGQLLLKEGDLLEVTDPVRQVCVIADGNPYQIPEQGVGIRYVPALLPVLARR